MSLYELLRGPLLWLAFGVFIGGMVIRVVLFFQLSTKKDKPDKAALVKMLLGPTGNLRAPTVRKGKTLIVGFDQATYEKILG